MTDDLTGQRVLTSPLIPSSRILCGVSRDGGACHYESGVVVIAGQ